MTTLQEITVLYVESDSDIRKSTANIIRQNGMRVLSTDTSLNAYDIFRTHKIDIIIIDCKSPHDNGLDFVRHLRQKKLFIPVILTTTETDEQLLFEAINLDISRCILKPYSEDDLVEALKIAAKRVLICHPLSPNDLHDGFTYDPINKSIANPDGTTIQLSKKEYLIIELLLHNRGQIIPYNLIEGSVWEDKAMSMDALRTLVGGIRKKTYPTIISNHNGTGYKIE
ncbi:MAG: response regulator [Sulfuricurvum sp.]|jgi:DNA-binding response OmpR family regulator